MAEYSHSQLSTYEQCALQYKLNYVDGIKRYEEGIEAYLGQRFHDAMEWLYGEKAFLTPSLEEVLDYYDKDWTNRWHLEIKIAKEDEALLLTISASTIDRLLAPKRREYGIKGRSTTKPGTLLRTQIPIHTFADWNDTAPGFLELDLVAHCGSSTKGEFINTPDMTDISTGWTVCRAFMGRGAGSQARPWIRQCQISHSPSWA